MTTTRLVMAYFLATWAYALVDFWRRRDHLVAFIRDGIREGVGDPGMVVTGPQVCVFAAVSIFLVAPFTIPFGVLVHFLFGGRPSGDEGRRS